MVALLLRYRGNLSIQMWFLKLQKGKIDIYLTMCQSIKSGTLFLGP